VRDFLAAPGFLASAWRWLGLVRPVRFGDLVGGDRGFILPGTAVVCRHSAVAVGDVKLGDDQLIRRAPWLNPRGVEELNCNRREIVQHDFHCRVLAPPRNSIDKRRWRGIFSRCQFRRSQLDCTGRCGYNLLGDQFAGGPCSYRPTKESNGSFVTFETTNSFPNDQDIWMIIIANEPRQISR
jgi:hypothetical protein